MPTAVSEFEVCVLVLGWLECAKFGRTAAALKREAKAQFRAAGGTAAPPGVRNLLDLLNDYVRLKEAETARAALATANPLAARVLAALDEEAVLAAGQQQCAQGAAAQAAAAAAQQRGQAAAQAQGMSQPLGGGAPYVWQPQQGQQQAAAYTGGPAAEGGQAIGYAPRHGAPFVQPQHQAAAAAAGGCLPSQPQPATPGRHRKGAPRKRQRGADLPAGAGGAAAGPEAAPLPAVALFGGGGGDGAGWGSPLDLLNLPLDACGLELLLDDGPMQLAFAEHLAQHINTTGVINPGEVLAELPADPVMAGVLQQVVRPGTASPRPPTVATAAPGPRAPSRGAGCSRRLPQAGRRSQQGTQQGEALVAPVLPIVSLEPPALQRQEQQQQEQRQHAAPPADEQEDEGMPDALSPVADHAEQQAAQAYPRAEEAGAAGGQPAPSEQAAARMPAAGVVAESGAHAALTGRQPSRAGERVALEGPAAMGSACTAPEQLPDSRQPGPADMVANTPAAAASQQPAASEPAAASEAPAACMSPRMASQQGPAEAAGQLLAGQQQAGSPSRHAEAAQRQARLDAGGPRPAAATAAAPACKLALQAIEAVAAVVNAKLAELGPIEPATVDQLLDDIEDIF